MNGMSKTVGVVFLLLIFFIGIFAPAFAISDEIENITINSSENICNTCCSGLKNTNVTIIELTGKEKNKAIAEALKNDKVKKLKKELIKQGYKPNIKEAKVVKVLLFLSNYSHEIEIIGVIIPFKSKITNETREIIYAYNLETNSYSVVITGGCILTCLACAGAAASCIACAASCAGGATIPACIYCLLSRCPAAAIVCLQCCCCLGSQWCCDML